MWSRRLKDGMETCTIRFWRVLEVLRRSGRQWHCEVCDKRASGGAAKVKLVRTECVGHLATAVGESTRDHSVTSWLRLAALCGAAGKEREQPSSQRNLANRVSGIQGLMSVHEPFACCRVVGIPRRIASLDHRSCSRCKRGPGGGKDAKGDNCDRAGLAEPRQAVTRLRTADAQPTNPDDKKHLLLKSGEVKW